MPPMSDATIRRKLSGWTDWEFVGAFVTASTVLGDHEFRVRWCRHALVAHLRNWAPAVCDEHGTPIGPRAKQ